MLRNLVTSVICCAQGAWLAAPALAQDLGDAAEIVRKVDEKTRAVASVRYHIVSEATGPAEQRVPRFEADVSMTGPLQATGALPAKFKIDAQVKAPESSDVRHIVAGGDGTQFYLIDHGGKKAYVDMDPAVLGSFANLMQFGVMIEFVHPTPFADELKGELELRGTQPVGDEACYEVHVKYAGGQGQATWFFSKKDFLPRRRVDVQQAPGATVVRTVSRLEPAAQFDDQAFRFELPDGYEKVDDFAP